MKSLLLMAIEAHLIIYIDIYIEFGISRIIWTTWLPSIGVKMYIWTCLVRIGVEVIEFN